MIELKEVGKVFNSGKSNEFKAIRGVSLSILENAMLPACYDPLVCDFRMVDRVVSLRNGRIEDLSE